MAIIVDRNSRKTALAQIAERVAWITRGPGPWIAWRQDCVTADPLGGVQSHAIIETAPPVSGLPGPGRPDAP
jgi:hypothetical protein